MLGKGKLRACLRRWWRDETAATAVEYAIMLALILMTVFASVALLGTNTRTSLNNANNQLQSYGFGGGS